MAFQSVPDTAKVAVVMKHDSQDVVNVFHFRRPGQWGVPELESLVQQVGTAWVNDVMVHLSQFTQLFRIEGRGLRAQNDVSFEYVLPTVVFGGRGDQGLPGSVAFVVTHLTGFTGRSNRGRTFFGGLSEADVDRNQIVVARANGLRDGLSSVRDAANAVGWTMVVVSRFSDRIRRPEGLTIPIIGFRYRDTVVDSQRRRLPGRGS